MHEIATKYNSYHRKHRYELVEEAQNYVNRIFIDEKLAIKVIMDCRTTSALKFRARLWFEKYGVILTKKQSMPTKTMSSF